LSPHRCVYMCAFILPYTVNLYDSLMPKSGLSSSLNHISVFLFMRQIKALNGKLRTQNSKTKQADQDT